MVMLKVPLNTSQPTNQPSPNILYEDDLGFSLELPFPFILSRASQFCVRFSLEMGPQEHRIPLDSLVFSRSSIN